MRWQDSAPAALEGCPGALWRGNLCHRWQICGQWLLPPAAVAWMLHRLYQGRCVTDFRIGGLLKPLAVRTGISAAERRCHLRLEESILEKSNAGDEEFCCLEHRSNRRCGPIKPCYGMSPPPCGRGHSVRLAFRTLARSL